MTCPYFALWMTSLFDKTIKMILPQVGKIVTYDNSRVCTTSRFVCKFQRLGARCSSVVRAFTHGAMDRRIDPSLSYFSFQPVLHDWCNKGRGMCYPVCGMMHIKEPLLLIEKSSHVAAACFLSHYLNGPLPYVWRHITVNITCWVCR